MIKSTKLIPEFIQALQQEIDALKKGKGGNIVKVFNGRLLRETSGLFVYLFHLENFLTAIDDTPAEIEVNGTRCPCQIISVQGMEVQIALERSFGQYIAEAKIQTNLWFLLEMLRKKYEESLANAGTKFKMSDTLFSGVATDINTDHVEPEYTLIPSPPNPSQKAAILASFKKSLAITWGPPGTGKTKTIAKVVEAHLNAGRRILLVSHANTAVDEALEDIAQQLKSTPFYQEGKLIRLGVPHKTTLEKEYPLVILDNIAAKLGESLALEKGKLLEERNQIDRFLQSFEEIISVKSRLDKAIQDRDAYKELLIEIPERVSAAKNDLQQDENRRRVNREKLIKANNAGIIKRLFTGLDPVKIQKEIDRLSVAIDSKKRTIAELEQKFKEAQSVFEQKQRDARLLSDSFTKLLAKFDLSSEKLKTEKEAREKRRDTINSRISEIDKALEEIQKQVLAEAKLVATTLTKTFTSKQFPDQPFDVLIVDESSMAPLPHLYWATSKATLSVNIVGDFKQLPPICVSEDAMAQKWLGRSIFNVLGINTVKEARDDNRVSLLDTQYRMAPEIAGVPNRFFYEGLLSDAPSTKELILNDTLSDENSLVVVDTSTINPWCSRLSIGGRFNIYSALVSASVARKLFEENSVDRIGIVTPYRAQARLIDKIARDWGIRDGMRINTVHSFQGGEEPVIVLDCVEGPGVSKWSMLDDQRPDSDAPLLLNVALTRAKYKVFLIAHKKYIYSSLKKDSIIIRVIDYFLEQGIEISSEMLVDNYLANDFEKYASAALGVASRVDIDGTALFTEKNFWPAFISDIQSAKESLVIMSPFASLGRAGRMMEFFRVMLGNGIKIRVYTRPPGQQSGTLSEHAEQVIAQLEAIGAKVVQRKSMHQKVAIIDDRIAWEGSLNILSHRDTHEQMRRFEGENAVKEIIRNLELDQDEVVGNVIKKLCPRCLEKGLEREMVIKKGRYGTFLGCSSFPECRYTENLSRRGRA
ncbi:AAA family ATPase [Desulfallas sp. Bu1-1]|uniref:AAA domain-containing protein n=1 Tax=Desulfallas sp. Bu1-1 TaxID=2787620 RepID=UPI00189D48EC|nr:AAA domain-containing protein [Desulfallas sp. Bu1-1]MBF7081701.1 AAA family ATPase [Desulfallas sp. Bu1-1]